MVKKTSRKKQEKFRRIIEKKNIKTNFLLVDRLNNILDYLKNAIEDIKIKNLIKAMNMKNDYTFKDEDINNEINNSEDYSTTNINNIENIIKFTLLCLLYNNDNDNYSHQLLHKNNKSYAPEYKGQILTEDELKKKKITNKKLTSFAEKYYNFFKNEVNNLLIFYLYYSEDNVDEPNIPKIRSYICDIYDGIVLLRHSSDKLELIVYDEKSFTSRVLKFTNRKLTNNEDIINFFKKYKNYLIIKKYKDKIKNCIYDCMIQIIYKIVNVLILNIKKYKKYLATLSTGSEVSDESPVSN